MYCHLKTEVKAVVQGWHQQNLIEVCLAMYQIGIIFVQTHQLKKVLMSLLFVCSSYYSLFKIFAIVYIQITQVARIAKNQLPRMFECVYMRVYKHWLTAERSARIHSSNKINFLNFTCFFYIYKWCSLV